MKRLVAIVGFVLALIAAIMHTQRFEVFQTWKSDDGRAVVQWGHVQHVWSLRVLLDGQRLTQLPTQRDKVTDVASLHVCRLQEGEKESVVFSELFYLNYGNGLAVTPRSNDVAAVIPVEVAVGSVTASEYRYYVTVDASSSLSVEQVRIVELLNAYEVRHTYGFADGKRGTLHYGHYSLEIEGQSEAYITGIDYQSNIPAPIRGSRLPEGAIVRTKFVDTPWPEEPVFDPRAYMRVEVVQLPSRSEQTR